MGDPQGYWPKVMVVIGADGGDGGDRGDGVRYTRYETTMVMSDVEVLLVSHLCAYCPLLRPLLALSWTTAALRSGGFFFFLTTDRPKPRSRRCFFFMWALLVA